MDTFIKAGRGICSDWLDMHGPRVVPVHGPSKGSFYLIRLMADWIGSAMETLGRVLPMASIEYMFYRGKHACSGRSCCLHIMSGSMLLIVRLS
jgi:hypothetical protein